MGRLRQGWESRLGGARWASRGYRVLQWQWVALHGGQGNGRDGEGSL